MLSDSWMSVIKLQRDVPIICPKSQVFLTGGVSIILNNALTNFMKYILLMLRDLQGSIRRPVTRLSAMYFSHRIFFSLADIACHHYRAWISTHLKRALMPFS
jgi:hypothetical protein